MRFFLCKQCEVPYPIFEPGEDWLAEPLEGVEFAEGLEKQREFCRSNHPHETLEVISDHIIGEKEDPFKILIYIVVDRERIPMIIVKTKKCLSESPVYTLYRPCGQKAALAIPERLLRFAV